VRFTETAYRVTRPTIVLLLLYSVPAAAAGRLAPQLARRQPPSLPHAVQNVLLHHHHQRQSVVGRRPVD